MDVRTRFVARCVARERHEGFSILVRFALLLTSRVVRDSPLSSRLSSIIERSQRVIEKRGVHISDHQRRDDE